MRWPSPDERQHVERAKRMWVLAEHPKGERTPADQQAHLPSDHCRPRRASSGGGSFMRECLRRTDYAALRKVRE